MMKLSKLMARRFRRPRFFAIAIALGAAAALAASAEAGTGSASAAGAAIASPASYRVLSAAATQTPAGTWKKLPAAPITKAPAMMVSVWTGREMIIHGIQFPPSGGPRGITFAYRPATRTWVRLADGPQPATTNSADVAVWTGSRMLVPGLTSGSYNPATNTWRKIARPGVSLGGAVTGWTGRQFLAWGGTCCEDTSRDGMAYNPATNTWRKLPAAPLQPRASASGAWTGKELVVAGGSDFFRKTVFRDAAAYNPSTGTWRKLPQMPRALTGGPALWDGKEILFLSSSSARGLAYNPARTAGGCCPPCRCRVSGSRPCGPVTACSSGAGLPAPPLPGHPRRTGRPITRPPAGGRPCPLHLCMAVPSPPQCGPAAR